MKIFEFLGNGWFLLAYITVYITLCVAAKGNPVALTVSYGLFLISIAIFCLALAVERGVSMFKEVIASFRALNTSTSNNKKGEQDEL